MKIVRFSVLFPILLLAISACQQPPPPAPSMTAGGARTGAGGPDYIDPSSASNASQLGLQSRDGAGFGEGTSREEGLLPSVYFEFDQASVRASDRPALQDAASFMAENPSARLIVEGHCDWRGTTEYNLALGDRRAASVKDYLVSLGVAPDRIETVSFGDREAATEASDREMQEDRRADLIVVR